MAYTKTQWINNQPPAIDADNLNKIEQGIYDAHEEITDVKGDIPQNVSDLTNDSDYQTASQVATAVDYAKVLPLTFPAFSSLPQTLTDSRITSTMIMVGWYVANSSAKASEWTVTPEDGSVTVSGSISDSTTLMIILAETM